MKATCRWQYRRIGGANRDGTWTAKLYRSTPLSSRYLIDPWKLNRNDPCLALSICRVLHLGERHGSQGSRTPSAWLARTVPFGWQVCINLPVLSEVTVRFRMQFYVDLEAGRLYQRSSSVSKDGFNIVRFV